VSTLAERLDALTAALVAAPPPAGGPAHRIAADYGPSGDSQKGKPKGGGRHVASKAGAARYGLPIGTPLDGTHSKKKQDAATKASYNTFMAASTPADQRKAASWLSTGDLKRAGEALFSFQSKNARDESARIALVKELADRGIDPHSLGYKGGPVVLNPNPKQDPTVKAAKSAGTARKQAALLVNRFLKKASQSDFGGVELDDTVSDAEIATLKAHGWKPRPGDHREALYPPADQLEKFNAPNAEKARKAADAAAKTAQKNATTAAKQKAREALAEAIAEGAITETEAKRRMASIG